MKKTAGAVIALAGAVLVSACTAAGDGAGPSPSTTGAGPAAAGCAAQVRHDQLPEWARAGFSGDARVPYAMGQSGRIVAVLFGYPLSQPPAEGRNNKILWVAAPATAAPKSDPAPAPDLVIEARLDGRDDPVRRQVDGGPGPSIVDLPRAGCWRLSLSWSGRTDTIDLEYGTP